MDCFYAAIHIRDDPALAGKPVVVGGDPSGRGVVAAASYPAREYGIHSAMPAARALRLCPHAIFLRSNFELYRRESKRIFDLYREVTPDVQTAGLDEAYLDVTEHLEPYGSATEVAKAIRARVREVTGLTVSVGVAPNRLVAKIASDYHKPDGLTVVRPEQVQEFLDPLPVRRIPGVGPSTGEVLAELGIQTIRQLREYPVEALRRRLGRRGEMLHAYSRGEDYRRVQTTWERKSLSSERTFREDLTSLKEIRERVDDLSTQVAEGICRRKLWASTVTLKVRYEDFTTVTRSLTLRSPTQHARTVRESARTLLERTDAGSRPVRLLGVGLSNLIGADQPAQLSLFDRPD